MSIQHATRDKLMAALADYTKGRGALEGYTAALQDPDPIVRRVACLNLVGMRVAAARGALLAALADSDEIVQDLACRGWG